MSNELPEICKDCGCDDEPLICIDAEYFCQDCLFVIMADADFED